MSVVAGGVHNRRSGCGSGVGAEEFLRCGGGEVRRGIWVYGGRVMHFEVFVFVVLVFRVVVDRGGGAYGARWWSFGLVGDGVVGGAVGGFEVCDTLFEVAEVVDACLEDGEFVHFLVAAGGDHVLQDAEFLVHL